MRHYHFKETPFSGIRVRIESTQTFNQSLSGLLTDIGQRPIDINEIARTCPSWEAYEAEVLAHVGPSGFIHFATIDHGAWIKKANIHRQMLRLVIGNPLIAITMLRHDLTAGLFAPVELLLTEEAEGSSLTYIRPSSLMVVMPDANLQKAAQELDGKLDALARKVMSLSGLEAGMASL